MSSEYLDICGLLLQKISSEYLDIMWYCITEDVFRIPRHYVVLYYIFVNVFQMFHPYVIDTSVIFNMSGNRGVKAGLRKLSQFFLG